MYKLTLTLEAPTRAQRDQLLLDLRGLLLRQPAAIQGKVRVVHEQEIVGGEPLPLLGFGVASDSDERTPIEREIDGTTGTTPDERPLPFNDFFGHGYGDADDDRR